MHQTLQRGCITGRGVRVGVDPFGVEPEKAGPFLRAPGARRRGDGGGGVRRVSCGAAGIDDDRAHTTGQGTPAPAPDVLRYTGPFMPILSAADAVKGACAGRL